MSQSSEFRSPPWLLAIPLALGLGFGSAAMSVPVAAQDLIDVNGAVHDARMTGKMVRDAQRRKQGLPRTTGPLPYTTYNQAKANRMARSTTNRHAQTCANARAGRMTVSRNHPSAQKLLALCRQAGY